MTAVLAAGFHCTAVPISEMRPAFTTLISPFLSPSAASAGSSAVPVLSILQRPEDGCDDSAVPAPEIREIRAAYMRDAGFST